MLKTEQAKNLREWILENVGENLETIAKHGCGGGIRGLISYYETAAVYDAYCDEIWTLLAEQAEASGFDSALAFITSFNDGQQVTDQATFKNLLTWYAVEELARTIVEEREEASN